VITYDELGVRPFINASGTITTLGGSLMPRAALEAIGHAAAAYVDLNDLHEKAGAWLARRIGVEAAFVSAGAASGMQLAAAACLTGTDEKRVRALPHTEGWRNEFVISSVDPHIYIHQGIEACGGRLARAGSEAGVSTAEILSAAGPGTAAVVHFLGRQSKEQLGEVIRGLGGRAPVIVDAAAQLPPRSNLTEIVAMGAGLVVFSGGKGIRGPQSSGLVVGRRELVDAVRLNASPWSAIGRGMKVGKEEILALLAAVDLFLAGSDDQDHERWKRQASRIVAATAGGRFRARLEGKGQPAAPDFAPRAYVDLPGDKAERLIRGMREGEPPIVLRRVADGVLVDPMTLEPGQDEIVARRLAEELGRL
jgi:L-seryl-tRNA(Ser) seleniumtransferase